MATTTSSTLRPAIPRPRPSKPTRPAASRSRSRTPARPSVSSTSSHADEIRLMTVLLHGFGVRYDLPLSLSLYIISAAAVVVISFVLVAVFASEKVGPTAVQYPRRELTFLRGLPRVGWLRALGGALGVLFLLAIIATGWVGAGRADGNPAEYLTWIYFWSGLVVLTGLVGPIWDWVNPFKALDSLIRRIRRVPDPSSE